MSDAFDRTLSATDEPRARSDLPGDPHLFLILEGHCPLAPPLRVSLHELDEIVIARGPARGLTPCEGGARLCVEDPRMSSRHARVTRIARRWVFEDAGSKNGSFVNGAPLRNAYAELNDGDILETGHTFFLFRESVPREPDHPPCFDASSAHPPAPGFATMLPSFSRVLEELALVARSRIPVLIEGETGTGKELVAQAIHRISGRRGEFVPVNCGAIPHDLVEGTLFGHQKGAFSGATESQLGLVRAAEQGTLFLDEIGDLPLSAQTALLRVLQEREVRPVGSTRTVSVDARVVAATHRPLRRMVEAGQFREDLLARLAGHCVELPPLRDRLEDIGLLISAILRRAHPDRAENVRIHPAATRAMLRYPWPCNVRELEKALDRAVVLAGEGATIQRDHLPEELCRLPEETPAICESEDAARREELVALLRKNNGNVAAVGRALGKLRQQVQRWLKRYRIDPDAYRS